jgi:hypothetical protein
MPHLSEWRAKKMEQLGRKRRMCVLAKIGMIVFGIVVSAMATYAWRNWDCNGLAAFLLVGFGLECCWVGFTSRTRQ